MNDNKVEDVTDLVRADGTFGRIRPTFEFMKPRLSRWIAFGLGSGQNSFREGRRVMLHSKVLVLDGQLLVVGSMNLDQRSKLQNTEIAVLVRSRKLSGQAAGMIEKGLESAAWHVVLKDGKLLWQAPQNTRLKDQTTEPDASLPLRLMLKIISPFTPDSLL